MKQNALCFLFITVTFIVNTMAKEQRFGRNVIFHFRSIEKYYIAIWIQKQRVKPYANENYVPDVLRAIPAGSKPDIFRFGSRDEAIPLISNFGI